MYTYLICDPVSKKFYVGSGKNAYRPRRHLNGKSCNNHLANITAKRNVFVFISDDDGLETRDEEQFYLDFYHGSQWCLNNSNSASGGDGHGAFERFNKTPEAKEVRKRGRASTRKTWRERLPETRTFAEPEIHRQRVSKSHEDRKNNDPLYGEKMRRAQRGSVLTKVGYNGVYPEKLGYRTSLSETFISYYTHFGLNNARN